MITVVIKLMWIFTVLKDRGFGGLDSAEWPIHAIHQLVLEVGKTDPREEVYIRSRKYSSLHQLVPSIFICLGSAFFAVLTLVVIGQLDLNTVAKSVSRTGRQRQATRLDTVDIDAVRSMRYDVIKHTRLRTSGKLDLASWT